MPELHDITTQDQQTILQHMAKVHPDNIYEGLGHLVRKGILSHPQAIGVVEKISKAQKDNEASALKEPKEEKPAQLSENKQPEIKGEPSHTNNTPNSTGNTTIDEAEKEIKPKSNIIAPTKDLRTWELGKFEGQPETRKAKAEMKKTVEQGNTKAGGTGETFNEFKSRAIPVFKKTVEESPKNTVLVTHSSVLKLAKVWDGMGRPDVKQMTPEDNKKFAQKYNEESTENGDVETLHGKNGPIYVVRHGQTEDNLLGNFRGPETNLTDKGIKQAAESGDYIKSKLKKGESVPGIITSNLPRTIHTSNIIHEQLSPNPILSTSGRIEVSDKENPHESARIYQGSYDRLLKAGDSPDDPDMKRMKESIEKLKMKGTKQVLNEKIKQDPDGLIDDLHNMGIITKK